jgi:hypothetical protein
MKNLEVFGHKYFFVLALLAALLAALVLWLASPAAAATGLTPRTAEHAFQQVNNLLEEVYRPAPGATNFSYRESSWRDFARAVEQGEVCLPRPTTGEINVVVAARIVGHGGGRQLFTGLVLRWQGGQVAVGALRSYGDNEREQGPVVFSAIANGRGVIYPNGRWANTANGSMALYGQLPWEGPMASLIHALPGVRDAIRRAYNGRPCQR